MARGYKKWEFTVRDQNAPTTQVITDCAYAVCTVGTSTLATVYSDDAATAKTNPVDYTTFATDDCIRFYTADSVSTVDIHLWSRSGGTCSLYNTDNEPKSILLDNNPGIKTAMVPFNAESSDATDSVDLTFDFPYGAMPLDVIPYIQSAAPGSGTVHVGLLSTESGGDVDGLLASVSAATAGYVAPIASLVTGSAASNTAITTNYYGILLRSVVLTAGNGGAAVIPVYRTVESGSARSLCVVWDTTTSDVTGMLRVRYDFAPLPRLNVY